MQIICTNCGRAFERKAKYVKYGLKKGWEPFCSTECQKEYRSTGTLFNCGTCGKVIYKTPANQRSQSGLYFCSRSCSTKHRNTLYSGEKHPLWKVGNGTYRNKVNLFKCHFCDYSNSQVLQVHHIDKNRQNNELDNLLVVCPNHHRELHYGIIVYVKTVAG